MIIYLIFGIIVYWILNIIDIFQTRKFLLISDEAEANIIIRWFYNKFGIVGMYAYKSIIPFIITIVSLILPFGWFIIAGLILWYSCVVSFNQFIIKKYT